MVAVIDYFRVCETFRLYYISDFGRLIDCPEAASYRLRMFFIV
jgi:hypothetical protein